MIIESPAHVYHLLNDPKAFREAPAKHVPISARQEETGTAELHRSSDQPLHRLVRFRYGVTPESDDRRKPSHSVVVLDEPGSAGRYGLLKFPAPVGLCCNFGQRCLVN